MVQTISAVRCIFNEPIGDENSPIISDASVVRTLRAKLLDYEQISPLGGTRFSAPRREFEYLDHKADILPLHMYGHTAVFDFQDVTYQANVVTDPEKEVIFPLLGR